MYAVAVVEIFGEVGRVGRGGRFAIAEHGDHNDVVGGKGGIVFCEVEGSIDSTTVTRGYAGCLFC